MEKVAEQRNTQNNAARETENKKHRERERERECEEGRDIVGGGWE